MIDHISLQVTDVTASRNFYEALLAPLGIRPEFEEEGAVGFGAIGDGALWLCPAERPHDCELHIAFRAATRDVVRAVHEAAVGIGAEVLHAPRIFPEYDNHYFGVFVRDPDGHNIEAVCRDPA
jgi:catechol 2,3-dioxygenase-like lactoylglutathione lyase family enzyme